MRKYVSDSRKYKNIQLSTYAVVWELSLDESYRCTLVEPVSFNPLLSVWLRLNCVGIR